MASILILATQVLGLLKLDHWSSYVALICTRNAKGYLLCYDHINMAALYAFSMRVWHTYFMWVGIERAQSRMKHYWNHNYTKLISQWGGLHCTQNMHMDIPYTT